MKNWFYFIAGVILGLGAISHTFAYGVGVGFPILHSSNLDPHTISVFTFNHHMIGIIDLFFGTVLIFMAFQKSVEKVKLTAWLITVIIFARWIIMILTYIIIMPDTSYVMDLLTSSIAFLAMLVLLLLGTIVKEKSKQ